MSIALSLSATFSAMDLMYRGQALAPPMLARFALYQTSCPDG